MNYANFLKMAHGDLSGLRELALDFFSDTRRQMAGWRDLLNAGNFSQLRDDLHRCKGGASLFGLERLVALTVSFENQSVAEQRHFDLARFEMELAEAERAVVAVGQQV